MSNTIKPYWVYTFRDTKNFINTFDEQPLWSAQFGLMMLKYIEIKSYQKVVDIGSGAGFPLFELAERLGSQTKCYGVDVWKNANERARQKIKNYKVSNVDIIDAPADKMPFANSSIDLAVSNLGINNFESSPNVFKECYRILKPNARLALTTNLSGHWQEFYHVFEATCMQLGKMKQVIQLKEQQKKRGTIDSVTELFINAGFRISNVVEERTEMRFFNGTAFLNHHFTKVGWLSSWLSIIPEPDQDVVFSLLEKNLNQHAMQHGLALTVPMAFVEGEKI